MADTDELFLPTVHGLTKFTSTDRRFSRWTRRRRILDPHQKAPIPQIISLFPVRLTWRDLFRKKSFPSHFGRFTFGPKRSTFYSLFCTFRSVLKPLQSVAASAGLARYRPTEFKDFTGGYGVSEKALKHTPFIIVMVSGL